MSTSIRVAPSILSADLAHLADEVKAAEAAGADWIHVDVMDGRFVPNLTFGMPLVRCLRKVTKLPIDVHLMIVEPEKYVTHFAEAGADHITVHAEAGPHLERTLTQIQQAGCRAGVAINPATPLEALSFVMHRLDLVLAMTVNPGFSGQSFIPEVLPKIKTLRERVDAYKETHGKSIEIVVDGGVNQDTISDVSEAGAHVVVAGRAVFGAAPNEYAQRIATLKG